MNKNRIYIHIAMIIAVFIAVSGCGKGKPKEEILARIGDTDITVKDFEKRITNLPERYRLAALKRKKEYLDELVNDTLLYQEAVKKGLDKDAEVKELFEEAKKKIIIARLLKDEVDDKMEIKDEDITEFYEKNKAKYMTPEVLRASHILALTRKDIEMIRDELANGADFDEMARAKSVDPTAQRSGDIGYFPRGQLIPEFDQACANLKVGEISGIVKTKLGYHIIKLTDRKEPQVRPIEDVRENIKTQLRTLKRQIIFNKLLTRLKHEVKISVNEEMITGEGKTNDKKTSGK